MATKLDAIRSTYQALERFPLAFRAPLRFRDVEEFVTAMRRAAATLDRINLARCNGVERYDAKLGRRFATWTDDDEARAEMQQDRARAKARAALKRFQVDLGLALRLEFGTDPRGAAVRLHGPVDPNPIAYY
jgi:hypothetical protein